MYLVLNGRLLADGMVENMNPDMTPYGMSFICFKYIAIFFFKSFNRYLSLIRWYHARSIKAQI